VLSLKCTVLSFRGPWPRQAGGPDRQKKISASGNTHVLRVHFKSRFLFCYFCLAEGWEENGVFEIEHGGLRKALSDLKDRFLASSGYTYTIYLVKARKNLLIDLIFES
jgi:hypothetical protein